jgi:hypothetical protein
MANIHPRWRQGISVVKQRLKVLPYLRPVSSTLREDFSIPAADQIPLIYLKSGSIF